MIEIWIALSDSGRTAFLARREAQRNGEDYTGPVKDRAYRVLDHMADMENRQHLFATPTLSGKKVHLFSLHIGDTHPDATDNTEGADNSYQRRLKRELDWMQTEYSTHFAVIGAWHWDGRQVGTQFTYDEDGEITGVEGTPVYPLPTWAHKLMPDTVTYDEDGNETSRTAPSSNSDLRDINLLSGQVSRRFS